MVTPIGDRTKRGPQRPLFFWLALLLGAPQLVAAARVAMISDCGISGSSYSCSAVVGLNRLIATYPQHDFIEASTEDCDAWVAANAASTDIVVTIGFQYEGCMDAAPAFPDVWFVSIDGCNEPARAAARGNYLCGFFIESLVSYASGYLSGLVSKSKVLGILGAFPVDPVWRLFNGFSLGVAASCPDCRVVGTFVNSFFHPEHALAVADYLVNVSGADVVFGCGGSTGSTAVLSAAREGVRGVGVDVDEFFTTFVGQPPSVQQWLITSAAKKVGVGVEIAVQMLLGQQPGAELAGVTDGHLLFDYANGGVGMAPCHLACDGLGAAHEAALSVERKLAAGSVQVPLQSSGRMPLPGAGEPNLARPLLGLPGYARGLVPEARTQHSFGAFASAWTPYLALFGGVGAGGLLGDMWLFNIGTMLWEPADMGFTRGTPPSPRMKACLVGLGTSALIFGGRDAANEQSRSAFTFTLQPDFLGFGDTTSADIVHRWAEVQLRGDAMELEGPGCTAENASCALVFGGRGRLSEHRELHRLCLDGPDAGTWTTLWPPAPGTAGPSARQLPGLAIVAGASVGVGDGDVLLVVGGRSLDAALRDAWVYTLQAEAPSWTRLPDLPLVPSSAPLLFTEEAADSGGARRQVLVAQLTSSDGALHLGALTFDPELREWSPQHGSMVDQDGAYVESVVQSVAVRAVGRTWHFGGSAAGDQPLSGPYVSTFAFDMQRDCPAGRAAAGGACILCPPGQVSEGGVRAVCELCEAGRASNVSGASSCFPCKPGLSSLPGATACSPCPAGTSTQLQAGSAECKPCSLGRFSGAGAASCEACPVGKFGDDLGLTACVPCNGTLTTSYPGSEAAARCGCAAGSYRPLDGDRDRCVLCDEGMDCPWGSDWKNLATESGPYPVAMAGYMTTPQQPYTVYKCVNADSCPGGPPGSCAANRDGSQVACGICSLDAFPSGSECKGCHEGAGIAPLLLALFLIIVAVVLLLLVVTRDGASQTHGTTNIIVTGGITVSALQVLGLFTSLSLTWLKPLQTILDLCKFLNFDLDVLQLSCVLPSSAAFAYLYAQLPPVLGAGLILVVIVLKKLVWKHRGRIIVNFGNTFGTIINMLFVSVLLSTFKPLLCYSHPAGNGASMTSHPSVLCDGGGAHGLLLLTGILSFVAVPAPFTTLVLFCILRYQRLITRSPDAVILKAMRWLFFKYSPERYYYGAIVLLRSFFVCFIPMVLRDSGRLQVFWMTAVLVAFAMLQIHLFPWRSGICNFVDSFVSLMLVLLLHGSNPEDPGSSSGNLMETAIIICLVLTFLACVATVVFFAVRLFKSNTFFDDFICHHKAAAAAQARYLKMELEQRSARSVFLDSDHLKDLDGLFDTVKTRVGRLIVYATRDTLRRPWCVGEVTSAQRAKVPTVRIATPMYTPPTDEQLQDFDNYVDFAGGRLDKYCISIEDMRAAVEWFTGSAVEQVEIDPAKCGTDRLNHLAETLRVSRMYRSKSRISITAGPSDGSPTSASTPASQGKAKDKILVCADPLDDEAIAAAGILGHKIRVQVFSRSFEGLMSLHDMPESQDWQGPYMEAVRGAAALVVVLSASTLTRAEQLLTIDEASRSLGSDLVVPVATPSFVFPDEPYYQKILPGLVQQDSLVSFTLNLRAFFRRIAVTFSTAASEGIITVQAQEVFIRLPRKLEGQSTGNADKSTSAGRNRSVVASQTSPSSPDTSDNDCDQVAPLGAVSDPVVVAPTGHASTLQEIAERLLDCPVLGGAGPPSTCGSEATTEGSERVAPAAAARGPLGPALCPEPIGSSSPGKVVMEL